MPSNPMMTPQSQLFVDYPAAHSMDTDWYAVDVNGEIGKFLNSDSGSVPMLEGMEPPTSEERTRREYSKAFEYRKQYEAVQRHYAREHGEDADPMPVHHYEQDTNQDSLYYWSASPAKALTLDDLPEDLRNGRHLLRLKDYDFRSREPLALHEHAARCYNDWSMLPYTYPAGYEQTQFPLLEPGGTWSMEAFNWCLKETYGYYGRGFFAVDESGRLALFRTDRFGSIPLQKLSGALPALMETHDAIFRMASGPRREELGDLREISDAKAWMELVRGGPEKTMHPVLAARKETAEQAWNAQGPEHWLEYPFGPASPRLYGLYYYDASWHHPMPYLRVGAPAEPLRFEELDDALRERMKPVLMPGIRFAEAPRVQPYELVTCVSVSLDMFDEDANWKLPKVWIDAALEHVQACQEFAVFDGNVELLLRRARRHVQRIASLARRS